MIFAPVGAKCAECAQVPKTALVRVKPERQVLVIIAGLLSAAVGGYLFGILISVMSLLAFLVAYGLGMAVGEAVSWASGRYHGTGLATWAATCAGLGIMFPFLLMGVSLYGLTSQVIGFTLAYGGIWKLIWIAAAALGAWRRND